MAAGRRCIPPNAGAATRRDASGHSAEFSAQPMALAAAAVADRFPAGALDRIIRATGFTVSQVDRIMQLINHFEQSDRRWWLYYGYCRALSYDYNLAWRGVTVGLYGATTYNDHPQADAARLFAAYGTTIRAMGWQSDRQCCQKANCATETYWTISPTNTRTSWQGASLADLNAGCAFCQRVLGLQNNDAWRKATWDAYTAEYWLPAINMIKAAGLPVQPAVVGFAVDWSMNEGKENPKAFFSRGLTLDQLARARRTSCSSCNSGTNGVTRANMWGHVMSTNPALSGNLDTVFSQFFPK